MKDLPTLLTDGQALRFADDHKALTFDQLREMAVKYGGVVGEKRVAELDRGLFLVADGEAGRPVYVFTYDNGKPACIKLGECDFVVQLRGWATSGENSK